MSKSENNPYFSEAPLEPDSEFWRARREAADACRELIERLTTSAAGAGVLDDVAMALRQQVELLDNEPRSYGRVSYTGGSDDIGINTAVDYEIGPTNGLSNPIAPPMQIWIDGQQVCGRATLGWQYEGPPGLVHGGLVAALFDQLLGVGQWLTPVPGFTGTLTVKYLKPTPLNSELKLRGWVDRIEGRKSVLVGEMWAGDTRTATCEGIFINVPTSAVLAGKAKGEGQ